MRRHLYFSLSAHTHTLDLNWIHTQQSHSVAAGDLSERIKPEKSETNGIWSVYNSFAATKSKLKYIRFTSSSHISFKWVASRIKIIDKQSNHSILGIVYRIWIQIQIKCISLFKFQKEVECRV